MNFGIACLIFIVIYILICFLVWSYNKRFKKWTKRDFKNPEIYFKSLLFSLPLFFILNSWYQSFETNGNKWSYFFDLANYVNFPNYLIFFATAISAYYIYRTLNSQRQANQTISFENRFFKFINYHRQNVEQLRYRAPDRKDEKYWTGNQVFTVIHYEIKELLREFFQNSHWDVSDKEAKKLAIDFVYQCIFYGAREDGIKILNKKFETKGYFQFIKFKEKYALYSNKFFSWQQPEFYYSGHVRRLGQYFRNLYQAIKYVEAQTFLSPDQKYEYVQHLRAQMSAYEQSVFFFNSLSELGEGWEWDKYNRAVNSIKERKEIIPKLFITKYDLIRNTLNSDGLVVDNISISDFYELVTLERMEECAVSGKLPFAGHSIQICRYCLNERYFKNINFNPEEQIETLYQSDKSRFDKFKCSEQKCKSTAALKKLREKKN